LDKIKKLIPMVAAGGLSLASLLGKDTGGPKGLYSGTVDMNRNRDAEFAAMHDKMGTRQQSAGIAALPDAQQPLIAHPDTDAGMVLPNDRPHPMAAGGYLDSIAAQLPAQFSDTPQPMPQEQPAFAEGGIATLAYAHGGPTAPRYLRGETDGMADQIKARIDGGQEARLAHGEFVIPADVVSHLGNGNSDAGAKKLYAMMDNIRVARTGTKKQGKEINPDKFLPGMGRKHMASGGITDAVAHFDGGGVTAAPSGLAEWAGPYVTNMLSEANALGNNMVSNPQNFVYQGPRAAGASALQTQGFGAAGNLGVNANLTNAATQTTGIADKMKGMTYDNTKFDNLYKPSEDYKVTDFGPGEEFTGSQVAKYMNPYLQQSLDPQIAEARRQAEIQRMTTAGRLVGSGAFGGGRQAVMEAEGDRNLLSNVANITGQGYNTAYNNATQQFNAAQQQKLARDQATEGSKQFGANFGMNNNVNSANFAQKAADASEQSKQYGAKYGLDALAGAANVYSTAGSLGSQIGAQERANIATQMDAGAVQRGISQDALNASMAKFNETAALPGQALKVKNGALQGLNTQATAQAETPLITQLAQAGLTAVEIAKLLGEKE
jgi:hypothetical protein